MSGNDQPPFPPPGQPWGPPPPPPPPPPPGAWGPGQFGPVPPKRNHTPLIIGVVLAVLLLIGGGVAGAVLLAGGDDEDEGTSLSYFCEKVAEIEEIDDDADPDEVAELLRDAGTPDELDGDAEQGRDQVLEVLDDAEDGDAVNEAFEDLEGDERDRVDAFDGFMDEECDDAADPQTSSAASVEEWCGAMKGLEEMGDDADPQAFAEMLEEAGIPDEAPEDARRGHEVFLEVLEDVETASEAEAAFDELSSEDESMIAAWSTYWAQECMDLSTN